MRSVASMGNMENAQKILVKKSKLKGTFCRPRS